MFLARITARQGGELLLFPLALPTPVGVSTKCEKLSLENRRRWAVPAHSAVKYAPSRNSAVPYTEIPKLLVAEGIPKQRCGM